MNSALYGAMVRKRRQSPLNESKDNSPPGVKPLTDSLAALVPAEVLALHALLISEETKKASRKAGELATTFEHPWAVGIIFIVLLLGSMVFYRLGLQRKATQFNRSEKFGVIIPPLAFFLWTLLQRPSALDAFRRVVEIIEPFKVGILILGLFALGALTYKVGDKLDGSQGEG